MFNDNPNKMTPSVQEDGNCCAGVDPYKKITPKEMLYNQAAEFRRQADQFEAFARSLPDHMHPDAEELLLSMIYNVI